MITLKLPWMCNYMQQINKIAPPFPEIFVICYFGEHWACPGMSDQNQQTLHELTEQPFHNNVNPMTKNWKLQFDDIFAFFTVHSLNHSKGFRFDELVLLKEITSSYFMVACLDQCLIYYSRIYEKCYLILKETWQGSVFLSIYFKWVQ